MALFLALLPRGAVLSVDSGSDALELSWPCLHSGLFSETLEAEWLQSEGKQAAVLRHDRCNGP